MQPCISLHLFSYVNDHSGGVSVNGDAWESWVSSLVIVMIIYVLHACFKVWGSLE